MCRHVLTLRVMRFDKGGGVREKLAVLDSRLDRSSSRLRHHQRFFWLLVKSCGIEAIKRSLTY